MANTLLSNNRPRPLNSRLHYLVAAIAVIAGMSVSDRQTVHAQTPTTAWVCFPTCATGDSHFLGIGGTGSGTIAGQSIYVGISAAPFSTAIPISIFDGDSKASNLGRWDTGVSSPKLKFELYADPLGDQSGLAIAPLGTWLGGDGVNAPTMPDNAWFELTDPNTGTAPFQNRPSAQEVGCSLCPYRYILKVSVQTATTAGVSNFKVRSGGTVYMKPQTFGFYGARAALDIPFVNAATYDGTWDFDFFVPPSTTAFELFDGDLDYGSADCQFNDTDDPDSGFYPSFVPLSEQNGNPVGPEGVPVTTLGCSPAIPGRTTTGLPADNNADVNLRRQPLASTISKWSNASTSPDGVAHTVTNVIYRLIAPDGREFINDNPSGNIEWEKFRIDTASFDRGLMDYHADGDVNGYLPSGLWTLKVEGQDLGNLSVWRSTFDTLGRDPDGKPTPPDAFYAVGGFAFFDNGTIGQRDGDPGLQNVELALIDASGYITSTTFSDSTGAYSFRVRPGTYTVRVVTPPPGLYPTTQPSTYPDQPGLTVGGTTFVAEAEFGFNDTEPAISNPDAVDDTASTPFGVPVSIPVLSNDTDPDEDVLNIVSFTQPSAAEGVVTQSGDMLIFTPAPGFVGVSVFTYTISDGKGSDTANVEVTVGKKPVVVTVPPVVVPYDGMPKSATCSATDGLIGTITYSGIPPTAYGPTTTAPTAAGTYASSCMVLGDPGHEGPTTTTSTVTINPVTVTVTASSHNVAYGAAVPTITPSYSGFVNGETATVLTTAPTCTTSYTSSSAGGSTQPTSCTGAAAGNYTFVYVAGSVTVGLKPVVVTVPPVVVPYDGMPKSATCSATDGLIGTITYSGIPPTAYGPTTTAPTAAGTYASSCMVPGDPGHEGPTTTTSTVTINPVTVTVTASSHSVAYGAAVPTITPSYSGFVNGETKAVLTTAPTCTTSYTASSAGGSTQPTSCTGAAAGNYTFVYVAGSVTVGLKPVVVTVPPVVVPYDGTPKSATCSATDGLIGTITYSGISPTVYGPTTTAPTAAGTYASSCRVPGGPGYEGPTTTTSTVTIQRVQVTVTASSHTVTFGAAVPTVTPSYSGFVGGQTAAVLTTAPTCTTSYTPTSPAGTTPSTSCSGAAAANYTFFYVNGSVTINAAPTQSGDYRMTGGGTFGVATHGFELHCNVAQDPNRLEVNWGNGNKFHLENLTAASCFTDPTIKPAPPAAPFNTYVGKGTGRYNGAPATAEWTFTDAGEPGTKDEATIVIRDANGVVVLSTSGNISKGNQQAHK